MLKRFLSVIFPRLTQSGVGFSPLAHDKYLDVLQGHGIDAHYYLPAIGNRENPELCEALEALGSAGYIMTDSKGVIVGKVAKARLTSDEKAHQKRATFKVVE